MSDLIVIGYENQQTARQAYEQVQRLQRDFIVDLRGLAVVDVDADGKTHVDTPARIVDLLFHLPSAAVDRRARPKLRDVVPGTVATVMVTAWEVPLRWERSQYET